MKRILSVILSLMVFLSVTGCDNKDEQTLPKPQGKIFEAIVKEVADEGFLVMPVEGSQECGAAMEVGLLVLRKDGMPNAKVGDRVRIDYDGVITRSIPGRLYGVYSMNIIG